MSTPAMDIRQVPLEQLQPDTENPRTHDKRNLKAIKASLEAHGQVEPLVVQAGTMRVIAGNGRLQAMRALGWTEATVAVMDVPDDQARRLSIVLNRTGELAGWDEGVLAHHLQALAELEGEAFAVADLGFSDQELEALVSAYAELPTEPSAAAPTTEPQPTTEPTADPTTAPAPMPSSAVRLVQLYLDDDTHEPFQMAVRRLAKLWGTDNITDTVHRAVMQYDEQLAAGAGEGK